VSSTRVFSDAEPEVLIIELVEEGMVSELPLQYESMKDYVGTSKILVPYIVKDWNDELSPWKAEPAFGKDPFKDGAVNTLDNIINSFIPRVIKENNLSEDIPIILGGYSLAGLFCLWGAYQTDRFAAVMAASPSVWFDNWIEYASHNEILCKNIYLSLGSKEARTKNKKMSKVSDCIKEQFVILSRENISNCTLEWNEGNHFTDVSKRCVKGFNWCMECI